MITIRCLIRLYRGVWSLVLTLLPAGVTTTTGLRVGERDRKMPSSSFYSHHRYLQPSIFCLSSFRSVFLSFFLSFSFFRSFVLSFSVRHLEAKPRVRQDSLLSMGTWGFRVSDSRFPPSLSHIVQDKLEEGLLVADVTEQLGATRTRLAALQSELDAVQGRVAEAAGVKERVEGTLRAIGEARDMVDDWKEKNAHLQV